MANTKSHQKDNLYILLYILYTYFYIYQITNKIYMIDLVGLSGVHEQQRGIDRWL
jgi:hypothetical protein